MALGTQNGGRVLYVFPVYASKKEHEDTAIACYEELEKNLIDGVDILVVDDGQKSERLKDYFGKANCTYHVYTERGGLTRSWNLGASEAIRKGYDGVIFSNADAYPTSKQSLGRLVLDILLRGHRYLALGPYTNNPGYVTHKEHKDQLSDAQEFLGRSIVPVRSISGFNFGMHIHTVEDIVSVRGTLFLENPKLKYYLTDHGGKLAMLPDLKMEHSLALVGQEDELWAYGGVLTNKVCGISSCLWHHEKGVFRR